MTSAYVVYRYRQSGDSPPANKFRGTRHLGRLDRYSLVAEVPDDGETHTVQFFTDGTHVVTPGKMSNAGPGDNKTVGAACHVRILGPRIEIDPIHGSRPVMPEAEVPNSQDAAWDMGHVSDFQFLDNSPRGSSDEDDVVYIGQKTPDAQVRVTFSDV
jgi:hypothetical protein